MYFLFFLFYINISASCNNQRITRLKQKKTKKPVRTDVKFTMLPKFVRLTITKCKSQFVLYSRRFYSRQRERLIGDLGEFSYFGIINYPSPTSHPPNTIFLSLDFSFSFSLCFSHIIVKLCRGDAFGAVHVYPLTLASTTKL